MKYKMIASDLDETLLDRVKKKVSEPNRQAISKAGKEGVLFVVATGRPFFTIGHTLEELDLQNQKQAYSIVLNGAQVVEHSSRKPLFTNGVPYETIEALFNRALNFDAGIHVYTDDEVYGWNLNEDEWNFLNGRMHVIPLETPDLSFLKDRIFTKILYVNTDQSYLMELEKQVKDLCEDLEISYSSSRYLEFNKKGVNKGTALLRLGDLLGIHKDEIIAVGDNLNDLAMIKAAGLGVGVANTNPRMIDECDVITENDCDHHAMAEVIERFVFENSKLN